MKKTKRRNTSPQKLLFTLLTITLTLAFYWSTENYVQPSLPQSDQPPRLYASPGPVDLQSTFSKAIDEAQHSILLIIYNLTDKKILHALNQKCTAGIPVRVVCDGKTSPYIERKLHPKIKLLRRFGPNLMHQKILVIDNSQVWIGSANMTGESLQMHANLVTGMESHALAALIAEKANSFEEVGSNSQRIQHREFRLGGQQVEMWFLPDDKGAIDRIKSLIEGARKTIRVAMFTWTRRDLAQAIIDAQKRGVKVEVVIDYNASQGAGASIMKFLIQSHVPVQVSQGSALFHHKFLWIDGTTLVNGSANWTKAAFTQNDDCFIVMHDLTDEQRGQMESLWSTILQESAPSKYR